jgi:hypothetical protein
MSRELRAILGALWLGGAQCIFVQCTFVLPSPCSEVECWPYACIDGTCQSECYSDEDCAQDAICMDYACVEECVDADCEGHYTCDNATNECFTSCTLNAHCQDDYHCRTFGERRGDCIRDQG